MKKKFFISALLLICVISFMAISNFTGISAEEASELPKAENLTVEEFSRACTGKKNFDVILGKTTNAQVVRELLTAKGLSPNVLLKDPGENRTDKEDHYEPLVYVAASYASDPEVIKTLLELGADFNINNGRSLIFAVLSSKVCKKV